jgi:hypothetical protein
VCVPCSSHCGPGCGAGVDCICGRTKMQEKNYVHSRIDGGSGACIMASAWGGGAIPV